MRLLGRSPDLGLSEFVAQKYARKTGLCIAEEYLFGSEDQRGRKGLGVTVLRASSKATVPRPHPIRLLQVLAKTLVLITTEMIIRAP